MLGDNQHGKQRGSRACHPSFTTLSVQTREDLRGKVEVPRESTLPCALAVCRVVPCTPPRPQAWWDGIFAKHFWSLAVPGVSSKAGPFLTFCTQEAHPLAAFDQNTLRGEMRGTGLCPWDFMACKRWAKTLCVLYGFLRSEEPLHSRGASGVWIDCHRGSGLNHFSISCKA